MNTQKKAFTLLELIVAMGIIAVLSVLGIVAIQTLQRSARDNQRLAILSEVNKALLKYERVFFNLPEKSDIFLRDDGMYIGGEYPEQKQVVEFNAGFLRPGGDSTSGTTKYYIDVEGNRSYQVCILLESDLVESVDDEECPPVNSW